MITFISGKIINFLGNKAIIKTTSGIGYSVSINPKKRYMINENIDLYTLHLHRDDKEELFGFERIEEREWVDNLMKVNGVGPKMAAVIIYEMGIDSIIHALEDKNVEAFCNVKGLGKKTAQKIVLELKGAIVDIESVVRDVDNGDFSVNFAEAMTNLGYKRSEVVKLISTLKKDDAWDTGDLLSTIKAGLAIFGR
jgi:holliday junction DNA helicase RuvA